MTAIFSPYHKFASVRRFSRTFKRLKGQGKVAPSAQDLPRYCSSCRIKLNSSKYHLERLLSFKSKTVLHPEATATTVTSGYGNPSATGVPPVTDYDVCRELDGFFTNVFSAFDHFAQAVNLMYFASPLPTDDVSFWKIWDVLKRDLPSEAITGFITSLRSDQWFQQLNVYRRCVTHQNEIEFTTESSRPFMKVGVRTKIVLPVNPFSHPAVYSPPREFGIFGVDAFEKTLNVIDHMYGLMETKARNVGYIPV